MRRFWYIIIAHPRSVLAISAGTLVFGAFSALELPLDYLPRIEIPVVRIVTEQPAVAAREIEQLVTMPVENAVASVAGVRRIESVSRHGVSHVTVRFAWGAHVERAVVEIREQLDAVSSVLPRGTRPPLVFRDDLSLRPVAVLAATPNRSTDGSPERKLLEVTRLVEHDLAPELRRLPGVGRVTVTGGVQPELRVGVDPAAAAAAGLALQRVAAAIAEAMVNLPVGTLTVGDTEVPLRVRSGVESADDLRDLRVKGTRLGDIAAIHKGVEERTGFFWTGSAEAVGVVVYPQAHAGVLTAAKALQNALPALADEFGYAFTLELVEDHARTVRLALRDLMVALLVGIAAAIVVLYGFYRTAQPALVCAAVIPVSLALTAAVLLLARITVNLVSLAGVAIGVGMVLDNAIVVADKLHGAAGCTAPNAARALDECAAATFGGTASTVLVFFPIVLVPGPVGAVFGELAITVSVLLAVSYVTSLTFVPAAMLTLQSAARGSRMAAGTGDSVSASLVGWRTPAGSRTSAGARNFHKLLRRTSRYRGAAPAAVLIAAAGSILLLTTRPLALFPDTSEADYVLELQFPGIMRLAEIQRHSTRAVERLSASPGIMVRHLSAGSAAGGVNEDAFLSDAAGLVRITLAGGSGDEVNLSRAVQLALRGSPVSGYRLAPAEHPIETLLGGHSGISLVVRAETRDALSGELEILEESLDELEGAVRLLPKAHRVEPAYALEPKLENLERAGTDVESLLATLRHAVRGEVPAYLQQDGMDVPVRVALTEKLRTPAEAIRTVQVESRADRLIPLRGLVALHRNDQATALHRIDRRPARILEIETLRESNSAEVADRLSVESPRVERSDRGAVLETRQEMLWLFSLSLVLLYMLLAAQLDSFFLPFAVLAVVPCYALGGLLALTLASIPLSVSSILGLLVLLGSAVNGALLLVVGYRTHPHSAREIARQTVHRVRPALAAFATTAAALAPITLGPFATNVLIRDTTVPLLGGLLIGTTATLIVFPLLYLLTRPPERRQ